MDEESTYVPWAYTKRTGPIENATRPLRYLPWAHLTKDEFVQAKIMYGEYWIENITKRNSGRVFKELTFYVNYETGACFPGRDLIAKKLRISVKTVQRAIKELEKQGLIQVRHTGDLPQSEDQFLTKGIGRSNVYTIRFEKTMFWDVHDHLVIGFDVDLECLTLGGRRRLPPWHLWYNCEDLDDDARLPSLAPPCPAIDTDLDAVDPPTDTIVSAECPTKGKEGFQGYEGIEGCEGTDVPPPRGVGGGTSSGPLAAQEDPKPAEDGPAMSEDNLISDVDAVQKTEITLSDYYVPPMTALEIMRDAERQQREDAARREKSAKWKESLRRAASGPPRFEIPILQEEVLLVD